VYVCPKVNDLAWFICIHCIRCFVLNLFLWFAVAFFECRMRAFDLMRLLCVTCIYSGTFFIAVILMVDLIYLINCVCVSESK